MRQTMPTRLLLPPALVERIDKVVGTRRSEFVADAPRRELERRRLIATMERAIGSLAEVDVPGWGTKESTQEWVRAQRRLVDDLGEPTSERERPWPDPYSTPTCWSIARRGGSRPGSASRHSCCRGRARPLLGAARGVLPRAAPRPAIPPRRFPRYPAALEQLPRCRYPGGDVLPRPRTTGANDRDAQPPYHSDRVAHAGNGRDGQPDE